MKLGDVAHLSGIRPNPCWRKHRWRSEGAAQAHLRALLRSPYVQNADQLNVYQCRSCGTWHVGRIAIDCTVEK